MKRLFLLLPLLVMLSALSAADPSVYLRFALDMGYTTNAFSDPLPVNGDPDYLDDIEFIKRANAGISVVSDIYFQPDSVPGLSVGAILRFPFFSKSYQYNEGSYDESDSLSSQLMGMSVSLGPIFRARLEDWDVSLAVRASIATYDFFTSGFLLGIIAEPSAVYFFSDDLYLSFGLTYEAHIMKFLDSSYSSVYEEGFRMITISGFAGIGIMLGARE